MLAAIPLVPAHTNWRREYFDDVFIARSSIALHRCVGAGPRHANHEPPRRRRPAIDVDDFLADRGPSSRWPFATLTLDSSPLGRLSLGPGRCVALAGAGCPLARSVVNLTPANAAVKEFAACGMEEFDL